jgi:hypothetical protein
VSVATSGDATYVLDCTEGITIRRVDARGAIQWSHEVGARCDSEATQPIAADPNGVLVGFTTAHGTAAAMFVSAAGRLMWTRWVEVDGLDTVNVASGRGKHALCFRTRASNYTVVTFDDDNRQIDEHTIAQLFDRHATCSIDEAGDLWVTTKADYNANVTIDGLERSLSSGTWAFRLDRQRKFLQLYRSSSTYHTEVAAGWVAYEYPRRIAFIDREGATRWHIDLPEYGCTVSPTVIDATATSFVAALDIFCGQRGGTTQIGDIEIRDHSEGEDDLGKRQILVHLDTSTMRARSIVALDAPGSEKYALGARSIFAYGAFTKDLGLGTSVTSRPPSYRCSSNLPTDAQSWSSYETTTPRCRSGFHMKTDYPSWPFLASLPLLPSL